MTISLNMDWHVDIFSVLIRHNISIVTHVPDAGHSPLLKLCDEAPDIELVTLTAEQDGVGVLCGAWAGGVGVGVLVEGGQRASWGSATCSRPRASGRPRQRLGEHRHLPRVH